jgi:hypothetical protein
MFCDCLCSECSPKIVLLQVPFLKEVDITFLRDHGRERLFINTYAMFIDVFHQHSPRHGYGWSSLILSSETKVDTLAVGWASLTERIKRGACLIGSIPFIHCLQRYIPLCTDGCFGNCKCRCNWDLWLLFELWKCVQAYSSD